MANKRREQGIFRDSIILVHVIVLLIDLLHINSILFLCVSLNEDEEKKSLPPPADTRIITFCVWGQHIPKLILLLKPADSLHVVCCVFRRQHSPVKNRKAARICTHTTIFMLLGMSGVLVLNRARAQVSCIHAYLYPDISDVLTSQLNNQH